MFVLSCLFSVLGRTTNDRAIQNNKDNDEIGAEAYLYSGFGLRIFFWTTNARQERAAAEAGRSTVVLDCELRTAN